MRLWMIALLGSSLAAQTIELPAVGQSAPLAGVWKEMHGDDARWADPAFDDSGWRSIHMPRPAKPGPPGYTWHRIRVRLKEPLPAEQLFVVIGPLYPAYEIFANGQRIGSFGGELGSVWGLQFAVPAKFPLPRAKEFTLAIRSYDSYTFILYGRISASQKFSTCWIATSRPAEGMIAEFQAERLQRSLLPRMLCLTLALGGLFFLLVYARRTASPEYLWCGLMILALMWNRVNGFIPYAISNSRMIVNIGGSISDILFPLTWILFPASIFRIRVWRVAWVILAAYVLIDLQIFWNSTVNNFTPLRLVLQFLLGISYAQSVLKTGLERSRKENLWPVQIALGAYWLANTSFFTLRLIRQQGGVGETYSVEDVLLRSPILLLMFAMGLILSRRSARQDKEQIRLQQEVAAAAQIQTLLLPQHAITGVESVYLPASEVGGDFYQVLEQADGARIIAVGDVSGKGLKAAMLVSVVVGALRQTRETSPAVILADLNRVLIGQTGGGFVSCCCARLETDGRMTLANAGHLLPYLKGEEVSLPSGIPLGIVADAIYEEATVQLPCGVQMTFLSDGIVEAENAQRELFGFARTLAMSGQPAREIAEAAKAWGQNDDITVVTVQRLA